MTEYSRKCAYCGQPIIEISMEHVIQQALGGRYESPNILCSKCNEFIGANIDVPFNRIFNPVIDQIENFIRQRKSSHPKYKGKARYDGKVYDVLIQNKRVVACAELSRQLRNNTKILNLDFEILSYNFDISTEVFLQGVKKIAFNFAVEKKIDISFLQHGLEVKLNGKRVSKVRYNYYTIPFVPLNPMDCHMELEADFLPYHNLILFSQERYLWCYVELFGTFQYYVLLSDKWDKSKVIMESYLQLIQKIDRTPPQMQRWRPKYSLIYSSAYDVPPSPEREVMKARVAEAVRLEPYEKSMSKIISSKISKYISNYIRTDLSELEKRKYGMSLLLYFDEEDHLIENRYRQVTLGEQEWEMVSYPLKLMMFQKQDKLKDREYREEKLRRLNEYLLAKGE